MSLTIDVGNTRVKWAKWQAGQIASKGAAVYEKENLALCLDELFSNLKKPSVIYCVCVASEKIRHALASWVKQCWQMDVDFLATSETFNNVIHGYNDPKQHGADRWASIVAGSRLYPKQSLCVIGAGTATTIDFLRYDEQGFNYTHLGGYILPSHNSMYGTLMSDTANVCSVAVSSKFDAAVLNDDIPDSTELAVNNGLHRLVQFGIQGFCKQAERVMNHAEIIITGGFAETILSYPEMPGMHYEPNLVMQGLYIIKTNNN